MKKYKLLLKNKSIIVFIYLLCTACSLKPIYNTKYSLEQFTQLSSVTIEPIKSIEGAEFYYYLSSILPKSTMTRYLLKVQFISKRLPFIFQKNSDVLREKINQTVKYRLVDILTNQQVLVGTFSHITSYSTASLPYHSYIDEEVASKDLIKQGAEEILGRLILYFK